MTPLFFLKHMDLYISIELVSFFLVLFFLDISGTIVIPAYFIAMYLGNISAEKKFKRTVQEIEGANNLNAIWEEYIGTNILDEYDPKQIEFATDQLISKWLVDTKEQTLLNLEMDLEERQQLALWGRKKQKSE